MSIYLEYIFRKENLCNCINFPFSIHVYKNNKLEIYTCNKKNEKFIFNKWKISEYKTNMILPPYEEIETNNFVDYVYSEINPENIKKISEISYTRNKISNNMLLDDLAFESYYNLMFENNIISLKYVKRQEIINIFSNKEVYSEIHPKWIKWNENLVKNMFPGEFIFYESIRN